MLKGRVVDKTEVDAALSALQRAGNGGLGRFATVAEYQARVLMLKDRVEQHKALLKSVHPKQERSSRLCIVV
jgi:hypothetical protein